MKNSSHPSVCLSHYGFKILALLCYLLLNLFIGNKVMVFIVVIILNAVDFWVVKNVTGR